jgi:AcrR family transcriptional regulator
MRVKYDRQQTRARLLDAATNVILSDGVTSLTLDAVARAAEVSKGGLLYHFPSKEALIHALVEQLLASFDAQVERALDPEEPEGTPGRWTRAYVRACFATDERQRDLGATLALVISADPRLMKLVEAAFARDQRMIEADGLDPVKAALVHMAADGLSFHEVLGMPSLAEPLRSQLFDALLELTVIPRPDGSTDTGGIS